MVVPTSRWCSSPTSPRSSPAPCCTDSSSRRPARRRWPDVRAAHPEASLYVVGEGPLEHELAGLDGVRLLGRREDVPLLLRWADLYVSASAAEGLSNALLEAMASGLPCVVTDVGGVADVLSQGVDGRIVAAGPGDRPIDDLVAEITTLLNDPDAGYALGKAARSSVRSGSSITATVMALAAQYRDLAGDRVWADETRSTR